MHRTYDGQHAIKVLVSCTLVMTVEYACGHTTGPKLQVVRELLAQVWSHQVVAAGGRH